MCSISGNYENFNRRYYVLKAFQMHVLFDLEVPLLIIYPHLTVRNAHTDLLATLLIILRNHNLNI